MTVQVIAWILGSPKDGIPPHPAKGTARLVLISIANHANEGYEAYPSIATIAREAGVSERRAKDAIRLCVKNGWLKRDVCAAYDERIPKDRRPNLYHLIREDDSSSPSTERGGRIASDGGDESGFHGGDGSSPQTVIENRQENRTRESRGDSAFRDVDVEGRVVRLEWQVPGIVDENGRLAQAVALCEVFAESLARRGDSNVEPYSKAWVLDMEALLRIDGRPPDEVRRTILWLERGADDVAAFWRPNVRSPRKLRSRWAQMAEQYARERTRSRREPAISEGAAAVIERQYGGISEQRAIAP